MSHSSKRWLDPTWSKVTLSARDALDDTLRRRSMTFQMITLFLSDVLLSYYHENCKFCVFARRISCALLKVWSIAIYNVCGMTLYIEIWNGNLYNTFEYVIICIGHVFYRIVCHPTSCRKRRINMTSWDLDLYHIWRIATTTSTFIWADCEKCNK